MSIMPMLTFKAGLCDLEAEAQPARVKPRPTPGYIYLYAEDELVHFCWRPRSAPMSSPELDLVMVPGDGQFRPYKAKAAPSSEPTQPPINGRIYVLKFSSSSQRHLFWLQSKSQSPTGDPSFFSPRDLQLGTLVDTLLQGEEVNISDAIAGLRSGGGGGSDHGPDDEDEPMEDVEGTGDGQDHAGGGAGGAGPGATGGDIRREGEESREGGADGGRAASTSTPDASVLVQNLLDSLQGRSRAGYSPPDQDKPFTTLPDLLPPSTTVPVIASVDEATLDHLLSYLPPTLLLLAQEADDISTVDPSPETAQAALQALSVEQKRKILTQVLHAPQFNQSLGSLTMALRDGGLPSISEALGIRVRHGGLLPGGGMPLGSGEAVEAFMEGVKQSVDEEAKKEKDKGDQMETEG